MIVYHKNSCQHGHLQSCRCESIKRSIFGIGPRFCKHFPMGDYKACSYFLRPQRPKVSPPGQGGYTTRRYLKEIEELSAEELLTHEKELMRVVGKRLVKETVQKQIDIKTN